MNAYPLANHIFPIGLSTRTTRTTPNRDGLIPARPR